MSFLSIERHAQDFDRAVTHVRREFLPFQRRLPSNQLLAVQLRQFYVPDKRRDVQSDGTFVFLVRLILAVDFDIIVKPSL
ncbi:MAG: hypothetical protein WCO86_12365 [Planctomycetota bacterium]